MLNYAKPETRKMMCDGETIISLQQRKMLVSDFLDYGDTVCGSLHLA